MEIILDVLFVDNQYISLFSILVFLLTKCHKTTTTVWLPILTVKVNKQLCEFVCMGVIVCDGVWERDRERERAQW